LQQAFLEAVVRALQQAGVTYAITGSVASNFWGTPRLTHDVDVLVVLPPDQVGPVVAAFSGQFYVSEQAARDAAATHHMFNIIDTAGGFKADFWVSAQDPFSQSMLSRRRRVELLPGLEAFIGSPEDVLLHKLLWHKLTPSQRQLGDAAGIAAVQAGQLDLDYLRDWAAMQSTTDLLDEVLQGKHLKTT
jgi:hypothetical protein